MPRMRFKIFQRTLKWLLGELKWFYLELTGRQTLKWLFTLEEDYICNLGLYVRAKDLIEIKKDINEINKQLNKAADSDIFFCESHNGEQLKRCNPIMKITKDGEIVVFKRYSWDGNSPKWNILDLFWLGVPDGLISSSKPITYYASLIHDALGQFKNSSKMPAQFRTTSFPDLWFSKGRRGRDGLYFSILKKEGFIWCYVYYLGVALLGPIHNATSAWIKGVDFKKQDIR